MSELLPCPFCGGEAETCHVTQLWEPRNSYWAKCKNCHISGTHHNTEAEAIAAWNTRAERTCKFVSSKGSDYPPVCSECGYELGIYDCAWYEGGTYGYERNYCPNCGAKVVNL